MALTSAGLKTHRWNNDIKSALFLLLYPVVITTSYMAITAVVLMEIFYRNFRNGDDFAFGHVYHAIIMHWYVPYGLIFTFLAFVYYRTLNQLDIPPDEHFADAGKQHDLHTMLETLCISRGLEKPFLFIRKNDSYNAYTTGLTQDTYKIVVTTGLLKKASPEELETVLAHELTHIMTGDTRLLFLTTTLSNIFRTTGQTLWPSKRRGSDLYAVGDSGSNIPAVGGDIAISLIALSAVLELTNIGAMFAACFVSRSRDFIADAGAIELTKNPQALIKVLQTAKINLCGFYREEDVKPFLFHYKKGRETCGHLSIEERVHAIRRFMPGS